MAAQNGAKTQLIGLVGAGAILLMLLLAPGLLRNLPQPTLAAVVIAASLSLADLPGMRRLWRQRRSDFALAMTGFLGLPCWGCGTGEDNVPITRSTSPTVPPPATASIA